MTANVTGGFTGRRSICCQSCIANIKNQGFVMPPPLRPLPYPRP